MFQFTKKQLFKIGIDGAIAFTILTRLIQAAGGVISIVFIARFLTIDEQGYYYTFTSIIAIQLFFELGLSGIITQYAAHEFAHLAWTGEHELTGDEYYKSRLSSLLRFCVKWFAVISIIFFFILLASGYYFFSNFNKMNHVEWEKPWFILSLATALNLFIDPLLAFFEGIGQIKDMSKVRLVQKTSFIIFLFIFFATGFKLYSSAVASLLAIVINYIQIISPKRIKLLKTIWRSKSEWVIHYLKEIFPYQWRIAVGFVSGYFIYQLFNPILFATEGPVVAGQFGMSLQALTGITSLSMSWITTKVPTLSQYIAKKNYTALDELFNKTLKSILITSGALFLLFNIGVYVLNLTDFALINRFMAPLPTAILTITIFSNQLIFSWATYLRCHKSEPFMGLQVVSALLVSISTVILGEKFGLLGIVGGYAFITIFVGVIWSYSLFVNKKRQWHI